MYPRPMSLDRRAPDITGNMVLHKLIKTVIHLIERFGKRAPNQINA